MKKAIALLFLIVVASLGCERLDTAAGTPKTWDGKPIKQVREKFEKAKIGSLVIFDDGKIAAVSQIDPKVITVKVTFMGDMERYLDAYANGDRIKMVLSEDHPEYSGVLRKFMTRKAADSCLICH